MDFKISATFILFFNENTFQFFEADAFYINKFALG